MKALARQRDALYKLILLNDEILPHHNINNLWDEDGMQVVVVGGLGGMGGGQEASGPPVDVAATNDVPDETMLDELMGCELLSGAHSGPTRDFLGGNLLSGAHAGECEGMSRAPPANACHAYRDHLSHLGHFRVACS